MAEVLKKFGRYILMDHIAQGGMAEIFRARLASPEGGGRILVIKRIQQAYGSNQEFVQMFRSEIKVTMGFNHPNICQLFDFGEEQQQPFIAMEFIDGRNIRQFLTKLAERKKAFPVEAAAHIVSQAAAGLAYAHDFKDKISGESLDIVHRDISPQNILVSYDGNVKVIDFGIAKAANNVDSTRAGVIKGKPSYLSPEQITGETLDGRSDIFALGIVFWEMLTGKKLFAGENDLATLKLIEGCQSHVKAPSTINPLVPKELDYIVLQAMAKGREKRFQNGDELQRVLRKFLVNNYPDFSPADLSIFSKDLFKDEIVADRKQLQDLSKKVDQLLFAGPTLVSVGGAEGLVTDGNPNAEGEKSTMVPTSPSISSPGIFAPENEIDADLKKMESVQLEDSFVSKNGKRGQIKAPPGASLGKATDSQISKTKTPSREINLEVGVPPRPSNTSGTASQSYSSRTRSVKIDSQEEPKKSRGWVFAVAAVIAGVVFGPKVVDLMQEKGISIGGSRSPGSVGTSAVGPGDSPDTSSSAANRGRLVMLKFDISPSGAERVTLDGKELDPRNPQSQVGVDQPLEVVVESKGFEVFRRQFSLASLVGDQSSYTMEIPLEPVRYGYLTIYTVPGNAEATLYIDGKKWVRTTPIQKEKLPVGTFTIKLSNSLGMEKQITATIEEGKTTKFTEERLQFRN